MTETGWNFQGRRRKTSSSKPAREALADDAEMAQPLSSHSKSTPISDISSDTGGGESRGGFRFKKRSANGKKSTSSDDSSTGSTTSATSATSAFNHGLIPKAMRKAGGRLVVGAVHAAKGRAKKWSSAPPLTTIPSESFIKCSPTTTRHKKCSAPPKRLENSRQLLEDPTGAQQSPQQRPEKEVDTDAAQRYHQPEGEIQREARRDPPVTPNRRPNVDLQRGSRNEYNIGLVLLISNKDGSSRARENLEKARDHLNTALKNRLMIHGPDNEEVALAKEKLGDVELLLGNPEQAERHYREALRVRKMHVSGEGTSDAARADRAWASLGNISVSLGHILYDRGDVDEALVFYESLDLFCDGELVKASHHHTERAVALHVKREETFRVRINMGRSYLRKDEAAAALDLLTEVFREKKQIAPGEENQDIAALLHDIGVAHELLGSHDAAVESFSNSLQLKRLLYGPSHEAVLETTYHKGVSHAMMRENDEAMSCFSKALQVMKSKNDEEINYEMLEDVLERMARVYGTKKEVDRVIECHEEMLSVMCKRLGHKHERVATALRALGEVLVKLGRAERAMEYFEQSLLIKKRLFGSDHHEVAAVLNDMGSALFKMKEFSDAEARCTEALQLSRAEPVDSEEEAISLNILGLICKNQSKYQDAVKYFEEALRVQRLSGGNDGVTLRNLGEAHTLSGHTDQAIVCYKELLKQKEATSGKEGTNSLLRTLGKLHMEMGMKSEFSSEKEAIFQEAIRYFEEAYGMQKGTDDKHLSRSFRTPSNLGDLHSLLDSYETSLQWYKVAMKAAKSNFNRSPEEAISTFSKMGHLYKKLDEPDGALICFQEALKLRRKVANDQHPDIADFLQELGDIHMMKMEYNAAQRDYSEALSLIPNDNMEEKLDIRHSIASVLFESGDLKGALTRYGDVLRARETVLGRSHPLCGKTLNDMGLVRFKQKEYGAAKDLFEMALGRLLDEAHLAETHPHVAEVKENIAQVERALSRGNFFGLFDREG